MNTLSQSQLDIEYHRKSAAHYEKSVIGYYRFYHYHALFPMIRRLVRKTQRPLTLDLGTGSGIVACYLAQFGCRVHAIDHSPEMLAIAKDRAASMGVQVDFELADAETLKFPDAYFDAVTINAVLHHLADYRPMLREAVRVLKPGGILYVSEPCIEGALASRMVNKIATTVRRSLLLRSGYATPPAEHEGPISGSALVDFIHALGVSGRPEFLVNLGIARFLPERLRIIPVFLLSLPTRRKHGDLLYFEGLKPAAHSNTH
jgi:2-polyprenyl-3-methyl-5-hydroxy-6-metoxy-1,4-benzoquinol methylase